MDTIYVLLKAFLIMLAVVIILNYMAFMSQEIERIRINTDKIVNKLEE